MSAAVGASSRAILVGSGQRSIYPSLRSLYPLNRYPYSTLRTSGTNSRPSSRSSPTRFLQPLRHGSVGLGDAGCPSLFYKRITSVSKEDSCLQALFHILLRQSQRWEHVDIAAPLRAVNCIVNIQPTDIPALKSLSVCATSRHPLSSHHAAFPNVFGASAPEPLPSWSRSRIFEAPSLDSVSLFRIDEPLLAMPIEWSKLTSLVVEKQGSLPNFGYLQAGLAIDVPVLTVILRQCGLLRYARFALTPGAPEPPSDHDALTTPIHLPNLVSLAFFEDRTCSASLFRILEAPQLTKLEFHTLRKPNPAIAHGSPSFSILPFLRRHGSKLEELTLDTQFILPMERAMVWETVPSLRSLRLTPSTFSCVRYPGDEQSLLPFTNCDLQQLLAPPTRRTSRPSIHLGRANIMLPKLESFECSTLSTLTDRGVLEFLKARKACSLLHAHVHYEKDWDVAVESFADEVRVLREDMDLVLEKKARPSFLQPRQGLKVRRNATF
ncbi:hypothetical protein FA13DRAFT_712024 [Coprinellus micaceus]|uniref:F-box domain-containing protein n=1 Tax=Coprinellus micaceus TaxID=71717 RepID=A0A4Y7TUQ0_COPMI|nr:hypothetical protein FA13DRAFT_712024 [Coprinellus micaceus]